MDKITIFKKSSEINLTTSDTFDPNTFRIPISFVRPIVINETSPIIPRQAIKIAKAVK